ncbi:MAG: methylated-DNA--[Clostridia bacterium]|nr:methylated-DNA--[protein]-cysteine S-methyltransferase [Clostridia bacterium]
MNRKIVDTPVGRLELSAWDGRLCAIRAAKTVRQMEADAGDPVLEEAVRQLEQYFAGERRTFDLPLDMEGSAFDRAVWQQLLAIPFGEIRTYGQIAAALGKPKASRAVGGACSRNPLLIAVPCHRVIAGTGGLTGFAAGLEMKRVLLALEGWNLPNDSVKEK